MHHSARQATPLIKVKVRSWRWLTQLAFILTVALVICRGSMTEVIRSDTNPSPGATPAPQVPGPATSLGLDLICCLPALLVLTRRAIDPDFRLLNSRAYWPMFMLALLAAASPIWASDKFAAIVSSSHFVTALIFLWSTSQLVRSWLRLRFVASAGIALLGILIVTGYYFRISDFQDLKTDWAEHKTQILSEHHLKAGSYEAQQFEKRVLAGQPMGFSASTNTYAALLVLLGVVTTGVIIQRRRDGDGGGWIILPLFAVILALPLIRWTQCRAAYATPVLSALMLAAIGLFGKWIARHAQALYAMAIASIAIVAAVIVQHGVRYGTLWHDSLNFRWNYWVGSYRVLMQDVPSAWQQFLIGVGWENFGAHYLAHRLPAAAEEIRDPHNFIIRVFVELGMIGGLLLLGWMAILWWELTSAGDGAAHEQHPPNSTKYHSRLATLAIMLTAIIGIGLSALLSIDFTAQGEFVFIEIVRHAVFLVIVTAGLAVGALRMMQERPADAGPHELLWELDDRPAPWVLWAILVALGTFLTHNLIEFSLFETGPLFLFALLAGGAWGIRLASRQQPQKKYDSRLALFPLALGGVAMLAFALLAFLPIALAEGSAHGADEAIRAGHWQEAAGQMADAFHRVPYNADYAARAAIDLAQSGAQPEQVPKMLDAAAKADPSSAGNFVARAQFELNGIGKKPDAALKDFRSALALDPRNVRLRWQYADALKGFAAELHRPELINEARLQYERVLDMNDQYDRAEPKRLKADEIARIRAALQQL